MPASTPRQRFVLGRNCNERVLNLGCLLFAIVFVLVCSAEWIHTSSPSSATREHTRYQRAAATRRQAQRNDSGENEDDNRPLIFQRGVNELTVGLAVPPPSFLQSGNTALSIARRLGYISVVDTLKVVTEEVITTTTVTC